MTAARCKIHGFTWTVREVGSVVHLALEGSLNQYAARMASRAVLDVIAGRRQTVVLDLAGLLALDTCGLELLSHLKSDLETRDGRLYVAGLPAALKATIEETGRYRWLTSGEPIPWKLVLCPVCDAPLSPLARLCSVCGSAI